jgi:hypothetical protein
VSLPLTVNGRIDSPGELDLFCFDGRTGQNIVAEVRARRLNSPLDSALMLRDSDGEQIAFSDDHEDKGAGLITHHADSRLQTMLPKDGRYILYLADEQQSGGPGFGYRLTLSEPKPGFELRVCPSAINARPGTSVPVTVYVLRRDGFPGEIDLALADAPKELELSGACIPAGQDSVRMTLSVPNDFKQDLYDLQVIGRAGIRKQLAVAADDVMQAFIYRHLVPAEKLQLCVYGEPEIFKIEKLRSKSVKIPVGGSKNLSIEMPGSTVWGEVELELIDPPDGVRIHSASLGQRDGNIVFQCDEQAATPGCCGNLIVNVYAVRDPETMRGRGQRKKPRRLLTVLPAIPFEIVK